MDIQRINRTEAERVFITVLNTEASSMTTGYAVALAFGAASADGHQAVLTRTGQPLNIPGWIGVAAADIAANMRGRVQCWGYAASIYLSQMGTSVTVTLGDLFTPGAQAGGLFSALATANYGNVGFKYAMCISAPTDTLSRAATATYASGILRCL